MTGETGRDIQQKMIGSPADWIWRFDPQVCIQQPALIAKIYEERQLALVRVLELETRLQAEEERVHNFEKENQSLKDQLKYETRSLTDQISHQKQSATDQLRYQSRVTWILLALSLCSVILVSIGTSMVAGNTRQGWAFIGCGSFLEIMAFLCKPRVKNE